MDDPQEGTIALGWRLFHGRRSEELIDWIRDQARREPLRAELGQMMGMACWRLDRDDEARDWMTRTVAAHPDYHYARADLANLLTQTDGRHQEAMAHIEQAIAQSPDTEFYLNMREDIRARLSQSEVSGKRSGWMGRLFGRD